MERLTILLFAALLLTSCRVRRHVETITHRDTTHVVLADSVRYEVKTNIRDTAHVVQTETEKVRVVEYYDPETGKLRQRVTESERELQSILDQMRSLQAHIDSIETHRNDSLAAKTDEVTEKETEVENSWVARLSLVFWVVLLGVAMSLWKRIVR
jgi:hypothetical protein